MEICTVGGYSEVGRNMTAVKVNDDVILLDMGVYLPKLLDFEEEGGDVNNLSREDMIKLEAIPNDDRIKSWRDKVKAIVLGHCHLDHIGATPYLAGNYNAPVVGTPYTLEVLRETMRNHHIRPENALKKVNPNSITTEGKVGVEMINVTHSTLQTSLVALHTKEGTILYANDFKFDNHPVLGKKPNYKRLRELGKEGNVKALIVESLYAHDARKTPSEKVAREMLKDVMMGTENDNNAIIATTFASHMPRLKSMTDFAEKLNRKVVFLGRSMDKYIRAAEKENLVKLSMKGEVLGYGAKIRKVLPKIEKNRADYFIICTGGQGEPNSVLMKMLNNTFSFEFQGGDHVIFSNRVIPAKENIENRGKMEAKLHKKGVRVFKDIHVSGHAAREDLRDLITMVKPEHIIPAHGDKSKLNALADLASEMGYKNKNVHVSSNGSKIVI